MRRWLLSLPLLIVLFAIGVLALCQPQTAAKVAGAGFFALDAYYLAKLCMEKPTK